MRTSEQTIITTTTINLGILGESSVETSVQLHNKNDEDREVGRTLRYIKTIEE